MKPILFIAMIVSTGFLSGCSKTKPAAPEAPVQNEISSQYIMDDFDDFNNVSTYDPELLKDMPRSIDLSRDMTSVKDQGARGTCSYFTATALFESAVKKKMKVDVNFSEEFMSHITKTRGYSDEDEGGHPLVNLYSTKAEGLMLERDVPYQPSWFGWKAPCEDFNYNDSKAPKICFSHNAPSDETLKKMIDSLDFDIWELRADDFREIITTIANDKVPLSIGIPTHPNSFNDNGEYRYTEEMRAECISVSGKCGGHAVVLTGYDLDKEVFYFKNSWGKKWGKNGYGQIPFSVVDRHVKHSFGYVELKKNLQLPKDHAIDYFKFLKAEINSTENSDKSVNVATKILAEKVGTHAIAVVSRLAKRKNLKDEKLSEENTILVELDKEEQETFSRKNISAYSFIFQDKDIDKLEVNFADNEVFLGPKAMSIPGVVRLRNDKKEQLVLQTTFYVYSDEEEYKTLKVITHPLNYLSYEF